MFVDANFFFFYLIVQSHLFTQQLGLAIDWLLGYR